MYIYILYTYIYTSYKSIYILYIYIYIYTKTPDSNPRSALQLYQVRTWSSITASNITPQGHNLVKMISIMVPLCHNLVGLPPLSLLQRGKTDRKLPPGK